MDRVLGAEFQLLASHCSIEGAECAWNAVCVAGECVAAPLFANIAADVITAVLAFFIAGFSLAAGVGGGGLFVPLLMAVLSFTPEVATATSQAMLAGGSLAALFYNLRQSHPDFKDRPLIDFELALLMAPALMSGAQLGSIVHDLAPSASLVVALVLVLTDSSLKSVRSARRLAAREAATAAAAASPHVAEDPREPERVMSIIVDDQRLQVTAGAPPSPQRSFSDSLRLWFVDDEVSGEESERVWARIRSAQCKLVFVWLFCMAAVGCKGLLLPLCSLEWWAVTLGACGFMFAFGLRFALQLKWRERVAGDSLDWGKFAVPLILRSFFAGILAAVCGIGGGMVMGPVLVELKVPPPISSATTATTLLLLSSSTGFVFIVRDIAPHDYAPFLGCVTACGALTGKIIVGRWIARTGKQSVIVWSLTLITVLSTLLVGSLGGFRAIQQGWDSLMFKSFCDR